MKKRLLITGASGFIGFHLANHLHKLGHFVLGVDNFNDYYDPALKRARALALEAQGIKIVQGDICEKGLITELLLRYEITHLVHLAAQAGVRYSFTNPNAYVTANIDGFLQILEACRKHTHVQLVYASSSSVYGLNEKVPFSVKDPTDRPANFYGVTKKTKELMAFSYHHLFAVQSVGLRFFTVYGPWGRPDMAYFSFAKKIFEGEPIDLYNFGNMRRDFTYIDDIISGVIASLEIKNGYHIFNLGNERPESLHTLVDLLEKEIGKKAVKNFLPCPSGEIVETYADIEESKKNLSFYPKTDLASGIHHFVKWYRNHYSVS